jgi:4-carboxymuconolactone decarboxylase
MTVLDMNAATLPADAQAMFEKMSARRKAKGEGFGGPYVALLNHPELARRIEELGFFLKFEGVLPRPIYQFIVLSITRATGAGYEWQDHDDGMAAGAGRSAGAAAGEWGKRGLVEIVMLCQLYQMFAAINQGFDVKHGDHEGVVS